MSREFRLGVFVVGTLFVLGAGVFLIGSKQLFFSSTYRLKTQFQNVAGLGDGAGVLIGGIHEGTVRSIQLPTRPDDKVTVVMDLVKGTRGVVKKDSVASIKTEGLLGDKYVEISFGSGGAAPVKDGDTIGSEPPLEIADMIRKTDAILDTVQDVVQNTDRTTSHLESISSKIDQGKGTAGALVNDRSMYQRVNEATTQAQLGATAFREDMEALKHNFLLRGFFKNRGYEDASDVKKHRIAELPAEPYSKSFSYDDNRIFAKPGTAKLKNQKSLNDAGKFLEQNDFALAVVRVSAGMKGDTEADRVLTEAQAMVVRDYLVQNFRVDDTRIKTLGMGKTTDPRTAEVQILVYPSPAPARTQQSSH